MSGLSFRGSTNGVWRTDRDGLTIQDWIKLMDEARDNNCIKTIRTNVYCNRSIDEPEICKWIANYALPLLKALTVDELERIAKYDYKIQCYGDKNLVDFLNAIKINNCKQLLLSEKFRRTGCYDSEPRRIPGLGPVGYRAVREALALYTDKHIGLYYDELYPIVMSVYVDPLWENAIERSKTQKLCDMTTLSTPHYSADDIVNFVNNYSRMGTLVTVYDFLKADVSCVPERVWRNPRFIRFLKEINTWCIGYDVSLKKLRAMAGGVPVETKFRIYDFTLC